MTALTPSLPFPLVITLGDPAGIGPEISLKYLQWWQQQADENPPTSVPLLFGDLSVLAQFCATPAGAPWQDLLNELDVLTWDEYLKQMPPFQRPALIDQQLLTAPQIAPAQVTAAQGRAAYCYIERAIQQALEGRVAGIVTGPIHKEALHAAGIPYPGHTEILADKTGSTRIVMMLTAPEITCALVTAHVGFRDVAGLLSIERISETIELTHAAMQRILGREPQLTMCGLNPHAGEQGLFGQQEEERFLIPAAEQARSQGIEIIGPLPPDTAFLPSRRRQTDAYICMYHDQGLIPLKALAFEEAVNVTLGLPIVRTSVDHGTAFDIAWQGKADVSSLIQAVHLAESLVSGVPRRR